MSASTRVSGCGRTRRISCDASDLQIAEESIGLRREPALMSRFTRDRSGSAGLKVLEEPACNTRVVAKAPRELDQHTAQLPLQNRDLIEKGRDHFFGDVETSAVSDCLWHLDGKSKAGRDGLAPPRPDRRLVRAVEGRVNFDRGKTRSVSFEVTSKGGKVTLLRPWKSPTGRANNNARVVQVHGFATGVDPGRCRRRLRGRRNARNRRPPTSWSRDIAGHPLPKVNRRDGRRLWRRSAPKE